MQKKLSFSGNRFALFLLVSCFSQITFGQLSFNLGKFEAGASISPSNFLGDLGGKSGKGGPFLKDNNIENTRLLTSGHLSMYPSSWLGIRITATYGLISGDDALIKGKGGEEESRKVRNLNFKSKIGEVLLTAEIYPTIFLEANADEVYHKWRPYLMAGAGVFHFNPQGRDPQTGKWTYLQKLHTEGEGFPEYPNRKMYKLTQLNIPLGIGLKYFITENISMSMEFITRKTFTDYIDDVSTSYINKDLFYKNLPRSTATVASRMYDKSVGAANRNAGEKRGTPKNMDAYYSTGVKLSFRLGTLVHDLPFMRCPVF